MKTINSQLLVKVRLVDFFFSLEAKVHINVCLLKLANHIQTPQPWKMFLLENNQIIGDFNGGIQAVPFF